jgi:hypothetical protein
MSTPLQKPLLLPGIAPHLFQSRRSNRTVKTSAPVKRRSALMPEPSSPDQTASHTKQSSDTSMNSDYAGMLIPILYVVHSRAHLLSGRRTAEALVETQKAEITLLHAHLTSFGTHAEVTTNLYQESQRQLMTATMHLNTIMTLCATTGNERSLEGALAAARAFVEERKSFFTLTRILFFVATDLSSKQCWLVVAASLVQDLVVSVPSVPRSVARRSDLLGLVSNHETSKPKPWFTETKPNHVHGFGLVLVLV